MAYYDREIDIVPEPAREPAALLHQIVSIFVRLVGVALLFIGLWAGASVVVEAWSLYEEPARIERFADAIERGSNLDRTFVGLSSVEGQAGAAQTTLRLSYFAAWFIVMLLLIVIGGLAMSAVATGGQLALYDTQLRRFSRQVIRDVKQMQRAA